MDGETLLNQVLDVIESGLPALPYDDPIRSHMVGAAAVLRDSMGRAPVGQRDQAPAAADPTAEQRKRKSAWQTTPISNRERIALELFGDERVTIRELTGRFQAHLPELEPYPFERDVRPLVARLFKAGELDRVSELRRPGGTQIRYRYFRNSDLSGPIADLDRTFHEPTERGEA